MALYLAFDVGGTKTACLLADEERVLARAEGGSIKMLRIPPADARRNLEAVLLQLVASTGVDLRRVRRTCIGTSGVAAPAVRAWMHQAVAETVGSELVLLGDEVIALDAAFPGARGVLVIAGTGSNIVGRAATGQMAHAGGWGPMLADEGSGHWIGQHALRACFRAIDAAPASSADYVSNDAMLWSAAGAAFLAAPNVGASNLATPNPNEPNLAAPNVGAPNLAAPNFATPNLATPDFAAPNLAAPNLNDLPPLLRSCLAHLKLPSLNAIVGAANAIEFQFAQLVPVVVEAARTEDLLALSILESAGQALALLVAQTVAKVTGLEAALDEMPAMPEVAYIGGILTHIPEVRGAMYRALDRSYPGIVLHAEPADALAGALWHARGQPIRAQAQG